MPSWLWENTKKHRPPGKPRCVAMSRWPNSFWCNHTGKGFHMGTNGTDLAAEHNPGLEPADRAPGRRRFLDNRVPDAKYLRAVEGAESLETAEDFALAPLVDKIAYGIARGLV